MKKVEKTVTGIGVPDGDGGSLEREDAREESNTENEEMNEETNDDDANSLGDESDESENAGEDDLAVARRGNSLGNDTDNGRVNESVEGAMNNPGVVLSAERNSPKRKYQIGAHYESEGNRTIGCAASVGSKDTGYYFKGE